ncbi:MAG: hypothetical protein ACOCXH_11595 [Cyclobacteriaceae bacterium]
MKIHFFNKPQYLFRPENIFRRLSKYDGKKNTCHLVWGDKIIATSSDTIGRTILHTGVHDLEVTEVIFRLLKKETLL